MDSESERAALRTVGLHFDLQVQSEIEIIPEVRQLLIKKIEELLNNNFEKLMGILYRIDVSEQIVRKALDSYSGQELYETIADLIIQRQIEKAVLRKRFSNNSDEREYNPGE